MVSFLANTSYLSAPYQESQSVGIRYGYTFVLIRVCSIGPAFILLLLIKPCKAQYIQNVFTYPHPRLPALIRLSSQRRLGPNQSMRRRRTTSLVIPD